MNGGFGDLGSNDIGPLLDCVGAPDGDVRRDALAALVQMPLEPTAHLDVARRALEVMHTPEDPGFLGAAARIPIPDVRHRLHDMLDSPSGFDAAHALAVVGDASGSRILVEALEHGDPGRRAAAAEALAICGTAGTGDRAWSALRGGPFDETSLLVALGAVREGLATPLEEVLDAIEHQRFDSMSWLLGDPMASPLHRLPQLPAPIIERIEQTAERSHADFLRDFVESQRFDRMSTFDDTPIFVVGNEQERARADAIADRFLGWFVNGTPDERAGEQSWELTKELEDVVRYLEPKNLGILVTRTLAALEPEEIVAGNHIIQMIGTGRGLEPPVDELFAIHRRQPGPIAWQAAWVASRAPIQTVIRTTGRELSSEDIETRRRATAFVADVARYTRQDYGPQFGGGTGPVDAAAPELLDLTLEDAAPDAGGFADHDDPWVAEEAAPPADEPVEVRRHTDREAKAYARVDAPEAVVASEEFELVAGIAAKPSEGVVSTPLESLTGKRNYLLTVHVIADGFSKRDDEAWRHTLAVTDDQPYPTCTLHLRADPTDAPHAARVVQVTYSVEGQIAGAASRAITVLRDEAMRTTAPNPAPPRGRDISIATSPVPPDLTVVLSHGAEPGTLRLTMETPHDGVAIPTDDLEVAIGTHPEEYAAQLVQAMNELEGTERLSLALLGRGRTLAKALPNEFWRALREVAARVDGPPMLLLVSEDPFVPWELAPVAPPLDDSAAPFLAAQTACGRWILHGVDQPPPHELDVASMAAVAGTYDSARWKNLKAALEERHELVTTWNAEEVDARFAAVTEALRRKPGHSIVHAAMHGKFSAHGQTQGLALVDDEWISPDVVRGLDLDGRPFVFLNACQVGSGSKLLGRYAGLAAAFLERGAAGVVAPLWSIDDEIAKSIALSFYEATLGNGTSAGEAIREERARIGDDPSRRTSTFLAYQYFGHPALLLRRSGDSHGG